ncbi:MULTISPECIES: amidohydrolase [Streptacidiphilus]|uniref:Amidohydrolase n=1 Tax=Streptacidiphilus cavernicola TaxID=3342716 RepID=A0ABV6UPN7_9ACTN|nr:amidohydrolase [Streptacidiphilus jeojiense]
MNDALTQWDAERAARIGELYRDLHRNPELSFQEHRTAAKVAEALAPLGWDVRTGIAGTGIAAVLRNGPGPVVMLRADMDALPVREETGLPYASTATATDPYGREVPVMHACGHDMHTACLLGAVELLTAARQSWSGTVVAVFQPAEENVSGAAAMVREGLFDHVPVPAVVLAQHVSPMPVGTVGYRPGPLMAASDTLDVVLYGRGGHGSSPENALDPVLMAACTVVRLQGIVSRELSMQDQAVVTVGRLQAGTKDNVIPDTAELGINTRSYSPEIRARLKASIERVVRAEAAASGALKDPDLTWTHGTSVLVSDPDATTRTLDALAALVGRDRLTELAPVPASEDAGVIGDCVGAPTVYWFWGGSDPATFADDRAAGHLVANHHPRFAPDPEPTLASGVALMTTAALAWLDRA